MKKALSFATAVLLFSAGGASAQTLPSDLNLERFTLNPSGNGSLVMSSGELMPAGAFRASGLLHYANGYAVTRRTGTDFVEMDRVYADVTAAYGIIKWLEADLQVPMVLSQGSGLPGTLSNGLANTALGEPIVSLRAGFGEGDVMPLSLSIELGASIPLGDPAALVADIRPTPLARITAGKDLGFAQVFAQLSAMEHVDRTVTSLRGNSTDAMKDEIGGGLGISAHLMDRLTGEAVVQTAFDFENPGMSTDLHLGLRYQATGNFEIFAAGGPSFGELMATPNFRFFGGVAYTMSGKRAAASSNENKVVQTTKVDKCAAGQAHTPEECPDADDDGDKIANRLDNCPASAEDMDGFADQDGCVDPDNDGDAVADADDKCPNEAGLTRLAGCPIPDKDKDGIADADDKCPAEYGLVAQGGCPIKDEDGDGLVDAKDECPKDSGLMELKGCPAKDSDTDGIADHLDNCPKEKGLANNSGCPAKKKQLVVITREKLEIKDRVYFGNANAKIQPRSFKLLKQIADVIKTHSYIEKLVIEGHTDDKGDAQKNRTLSLTRADAVKSYLIKQGVDPTRIETKGIGPDRPIDTNKTAAGRANNRRVEFQVVMPSEETQPQG